MDKYIDQLKPYIENLFKDDFSGHDMGHLERTMNTALYLQKKEGGDKIIIGIASYLHDIHRIMQNQTGKFVSPKSSLTTVRKLLDKTDLTPAQKEKICYCIEYHEQYNWNGNNVNDINTLILQDADNLDAIGAIGIGRTFSYSGAHNAVMYNPNVSLNYGNDFSEDNEKDASTIHHFYHKLFKLEKNMNTKTAKKLAKTKTKFMKKFVNKFLSEWNANY